MAGARTLGILGGLVAVAVAAGLWLVLGTDSGPSDDAADGANAADVAPKNAPTTAPAGKAPRQRAKSGGAASISGVVKRRAGAAPAANQDVQLLRDGFDAWTATTDASGAFRLDALPDGGPFELRVEAKGFATVRLPGIGLGRGEARDAGTLWLDQAVRLPVAVRDFADRPIAGAAVAAFIAPEYGDDFDWSKAYAQMAVEPVAVANATTDANGAAVFPELASGSWTITASAPGRARGAARHVEIRGGEDPPEVVIRLAAGNELTGRVLDHERKPVAGATVMAGSPNDAWDLGSAATRERTTSDAAGNYTLSGLDTGDVALWVGRAGTVPSLRATVRVPGVKSYDLVLRATGSIAGVVTEKGTSKPVEGADVRATQWGMSVETAEATTDAQGRYRIESFPVGSVSDLRAEKEGLVHVPKDEAMFGGGDRRVHAGDTLTEDIVLEKGATVKGRVTTGGAPVAGAKVIVRVGRPNRGIEFTETATTDADGRWKIEGVLPGAAFGEAKKDGYFLEGFPEQWWTFTEDAEFGKPFRVEVPEAGEATLDLVLSRGSTVKGRVEGPDGPVAGATVWSQSAKATSGADGTFTLDGVTPGPAVVIVAAKRGLTATKESRFEVAADGPSPEVVLRLAKSAVVRGRVTTADGSPLRDARVAVQPKTDDPQQVWINMQPVDWRNAHAVRPDGTYEAELGGTSGSFVVHAMDAAHGTAESAAITVQEGRADYEADLRLGAGGVLRGRVTTGGRGVAGADVTLTKHVEQDGGMRFRTSMIGGGGATVWAVTGEDGSFEARPIGDGAWDVKVACPGFVRGEAPNVKVPQQGDVVIDLAAALEISGRVTFEDGRPVEGMSVSAVAESAPSARQFMSFGGDDGDDESQQATTDREGRFRLRGLKPGNYRVRAEPPWMSKVNARAATSDPVAAGAADVKVTVRAGGVIAGHVLDEARKPVAAAWVTCNPAEPGDDPSFHGAATDAKGAFEINGLNDGKYTLYVQSQSGGKQPTQKADVMTGTKDVEIVMTAGLAIEGVVVKADGKPVAGVYVQAERITSDDEDESSISFGSQMSATGADGKFRVAGLAPGHYKLELNDWSGTSQALRLTGASDIAAGATGLRLVASEGLRVSGVVVDDAGAPVAGARVDAVIENEQNRSATTDAAGRFDVSGLPDVKVKLTCSAPGRVQASVTGVAAGARDVRIVLAKGRSIAGRVLDASGKPYQGRLIVTRMPGPGDTEEVGNSSQWSESNADGKFTVDGLRDGKWAISAFVANPDQPNSFRSVALGTADAGAADLDLRLPK